MAVIPPDIASPNIPRTTRGLKNRNPGNLRWTPKDRWQGLTGQDNKGFCVFSSDVHGIRALVRDLRTDYLRDGQTTIESLIAEYAPPHENDTQAYVDYVAQALDIGPRTEIPALTPAVATELAIAIIRIEQGVQPYPIATIAAGVAAGLA